MKNLSLIFTIALFTILCSCEKQEVLVKESLPQYDETNSEQFKWEELPEELKNAHPLDYHSEEQISAQSKARFAIGPWGGNGGSYFSFAPSTTSDLRIYAIAMRADRRVDRLVVWYISPSTGTIYKSIEKGGNGGTYYLNFFSSDEVIISAEGRSGSRLDYLKFFTNKKTFGYGGNGGRYFLANIPSSYHINGFFGRSASEIDQIGFFYTQQ